MKKFINASLPTSSTAFRKVEILFDDKIRKISTDEIETEEPVELIDLEGALVLPGAIDTHTHILGESAAQAKQLQSFTKAALAGGWTTIAEMSFHSDRPVFELGDVQHFKDLVEANSHVDMALWGNVNIADYPYHAEAAQLLWTKGVVGISLFSPSPNPHLQEMSFDEIMDLFMDIYESDTAFSFEGYNTEMDSSFSYPAQRDAIKKLLRRMQENPIHIPKVSSWETIEFINTISKRSDISFSMSIRDLMDLLDEEEANQTRLADLVEHLPEFMDLLKTNKIYMFGNDLDCNADSKGDGSRGNPALIAGYSYLWMLSELWKARKIPLATCLKMISENPAKRMGLYPQKGCLEAGSDADFVIYDPGASTHMKAFGYDKTLSGAIKEVYLRGQATNPKSSKPSGIYLSRQTNPKRRYNKTTWI